MKKYLLCMTVSAFFFNYGSGQIQKTVLKTNLTGINFATLQVADIITGKYKTSSFSQRFGLLGQVKSRYKSFPLTSSSQKQGEGKNGLTYYISRNSLSLPASSTGSTTTRSQGQDDLVCESSPVKTAVNLTEGLLLGGKYNFNTTNIFPGALFRDDDVIKGIFTPVTNQQRKPGTIFIDVLSAGSNISEPVSDFNKRDIVRESTNNLLAKKVGNSIPPVINDQFSLELRAKDEFSLKANASMDIDLAALFDIPAQIGQELGASASLSTEFNAAVASIQNIYYTVSLGGDGPASTVEGTVPSNLLCVTDVAYGTIAYIFVANAKTRIEASVTASRLLEIAEIGGVSQSLEAEVTRLLEGKIVRIHIYGGVNSSSVATVTSLASLRNAMSKMNPTVLQNGALPLFYNLRYASDNSPAQIGAFADFTDTRCFKASKLEVKVEAKLTANDELDGTEELYGNIRIDGNINSIINDRDFFKKSRSEAAKRIQNQSLDMLNQSITFNVNPAKVDFDSEVLKFTIDIKDKIEDGPEWLGASDKAKRDGFVQYTPKERNVNLGEIRDSPNGKLVKNYDVTEGRSTVNVKVTFQLKN